VGAIHSGTPKRLPVHITPPQPVAWVNILALLTMYLYSIHAMERTTTRMTARQVCACSGADIWRASSVVNYRLVLFI